MLLIDGAKYQEWIPEKEVEEFHPLVSEHFKDIFGDKSIIIDGNLLKSDAGIGSRPDWIVITFTGAPQWYIVEAELSSHQVYDHIVNQVGRFINGIKNNTTQRKIIDTVYNAIMEDKIHKVELEEYLGPNEIHKFISDLIPKTPILSIIIERKNPELDESLELLRYSPIKTIEFKTYRRIGAEAVHAHIFEPLFESQDNDFGKTILKPIDNTAGENETETVSYNEGYHLSKTNQIMKGIYFELKSELQKIKPDLKFNPTKYYISIVNNRSLAYIFVKKNKLNIVVMLPVSLLDQKIKLHAITHKTELTQKFYGGECAAIIIEDHSNLDEILTILKLAVSKN